MHSSSQYSPDSSDLSEKIDRLTALAAAYFLQLSQLTSGQDLIDLLAYLVPNALLKNDMIS